MDRLTEDLRASLAGQVASAPALPGLGDDVVRRGRRRRRARRAGAVLGVVLATAGGAGVVAGVLDRVPPPVAASLDGPPRVPLVVDDGTGVEVLDWPSGVPRSRSLDGEARAVAATPAGVLVLGGDTLRLLEPEAERLRLVLDGVAQVGVAVAADGGRAAVITLGDGGAERHLREVELPSGRVLRTVPLMQPLVGPDEPVVPVAYSGDRVLLTLGEGRTQRAAVWEPGEDQVVGAVHDVAAAEDGTTQGGTGALAAFAVRDDRCRTRVLRFADGGRGWELCREPFVGFSPDGELVLASNALGDGLVVRDARDGGEVARFAVPGSVRAVGWESGDTVLQTTVEDGETVVVRCSVSSERCGTVATFPYVDRIPQPLPPAGLDASDT